MDERRQHIRKRINSYIAVYERRTDDHLGCLVDMTPSGIKLMSNRAFEKGGTVSLRMEIPFEIKGGKNIFVDVLCKWCNGKNYPDLYEIGFEFQNVAPETEDIIRHLIASPLFKETLKFAAS